MKSTKLLLKIICLITVAALVSFALCACVETVDEDEEEQQTAVSEKSETEDQPTVNIPEGKTPYAVIDIKDYGIITVKLDYKSAPITVSNFITLAESKFYDGLTFHRIMEGFMMQGGDPKGNGTGGSDKNIKGEFSANGVKNDLSHTRGAISMARATPYDSASSQFFIVQKDEVADSLDGLYACFGYVTEGIEVVDKVCETAKPTDNNGTIPKENQPVINSITIEYK